MMRGNFFLLKKRWRGGHTGKVAGTRETSTLKITFKDHKQCWHAESTWNKLASDIAGLLFLNLLFPGHDWGGLSFWGSDVYSWLYHWPQIYKLIKLMISSCYPVITHVYAYQLGKIYNGPVSLQHHSVGLKGDRASSPAFASTACSRRQVSGKIRVAEDSHGQQDHAVDVRHRPPQRPLRGVCHLQLHGFLLFLCHLGALLLVQATKQVVGPPATSLFPLRNFYFKSLLWGFWDVLLSCIQVNALLFAVAQAPT